MTILCKAARVPRFSSIHDAVKSKTKRMPRFKHPNTKARVLCKHDGYIFYDDYTFRNTLAYDTHELNQWDIVSFPKTDHNMLFCRMAGDNNWATDYDSGNEEEIALGEAVARALMNQEMKKVLTGKYDDTTERK